MKSRSAVLAAVLLTGLTIAGPQAEQNSSLVPPPGMTEVLSLRTERSRTYADEQGKYTTRSFTNPIHRLDRQGRWVSLETDATSEVYPLENWTGTIENSYFAGYDHMRWGYYGFGGWKQRGWAVFDLSAVPVGISVDAAILNYYIYDYDQAEQDGSPFEIRLCDADPRSGGDDASTVSSAIGSGSRLAPTRTSALIGSYSDEFNATGIQAIQDRLASGWITIGWLYTGQVVPTVDHYSMASGYTVHEGAFRPYLELTYEPVPILIYPPDDAAVNDQTPTFEWYDMGPEYTYHIQVADDEGFS